MMSRPEDGSALYGFSGVHDHLEEGENRGSTAVQAAQEHLQVVESTMPARPGRNRLPGTRVVFVQ